MRDELLLRPVLDLDVACAEPWDAANRFARRFGGSVFPLSERHGAWRVVVDGIDETVDFTPVGDGIDADLATRDSPSTPLPCTCAPARATPHDGRAYLAAGVEAVGGVTLDERPLSPAWTTTVIPASFTRAQNGSNIGSNGFFGRPGWSAPRCASR